MIEQHEQISGGQEHMPITRDMFGEEKAGEMAFALISNPKTICEAIIGEEGEVCGGKARETLDFDVFGNLEMIAHCGGSHGRLIEERVAEDLRNAGIFSSFGRNGCGRSYDKPDFSTRST